MTRLLSGLLLFFMFSMCSNAEAAIQNAKNYDLELKNKQEDYFKTKIPLLFTQSTNSTKSAPENLKKIPNKNWKFYKNEILSFSMSYPLSWKETFWLKEEDTSKNKSYAFGYIENKELKIEFIYFQKDNNETMSEFVRKKLKYYNKIFSKEIATQNNLKFWRFRSYIQGVDDDLFVIDSFSQLKNDLVLLQRGYLSQKSLAAKDSNYTLLNAIMNTLKKY
jgi:hypothetical protein